MDCDWTPATAQRTSTAPSRTRSDRSTSMVKSTCPGVSMMLMSWSFQDSRWRPMDGDAALPLQFHVVHGRADAVLALDLVDGVDPLGVEQDPLGQRGLARVDVGRDPDVSDLVDIATHDLCPEPGALLERGRPSPTGRGLLLVLGLPVVRSETLGSRGRERVQLSHWLVNSAFAVLCRYLTVLHPFPFPFPFPQCLR